MYRTAHREMSAWLARPDRKPLLLRGARQVGKSTLVRHFAEDAGYRLCELNLERAQRLAPAFKTLDPEKVLDAVLAETGHDLRVTNQSLLFFDEIQAIPEAIQTLRYFFEELPHLPVVAAGSLLEVALERAKIPMPVGRIESLWLGPMTFDEFLMALRDEGGRDLDADIQALNRFEIGGRISSAMHERLCRLQRDYLCVGGMPEPVQRFVRGGTARDVTRVHQQLVDSYRDDFAKYSSGAVVQLLDLALTLAPTLIGRKLKWVSISRDHQSREIKRAIWLLQKAGVVHLVPHTDANGPPLLAQADLDIVKPLFVDVGLANRLLGLDWQGVARLGPDRLVNEGPLAEQFVGQHLVAQGPSGEGGRPQAFYWLREGRSDCAELDFVVSHRREVIPIEVKSGKAGSLKSLLQFAREKAPRRAVRFDLNPPSVHKASAQGTRFQLVSLPLYFAGHLARLFG